MVLMDKEGGRFDQFLLEVQMGHVKGAEIRWVYAFNPNVSTVVSDIWEVGGIYNYLTTPQTLWLWSLSASDVGKQVTISGLDGDYNRQTEVITLNGTTPVQTTKSWIRACNVENSGTNDLIGNVYVSRVSGSTLQQNVINFVDSKFQHSTQSCLTIPANKTGFIFQGEASVGKLKDATVYFKTREFGKAFITRDIMDMYQNTISVTRPFTRLDQKTDMKVSAVSSSAGTSVAIQYGVLTLDNDVYDLK